MKMTLHTTPHHPPTHRNSMLAISQLLLTWFWGNFKGRFLWTFRADSNCQGDICPDNICPRNICPYQQYLSCYWPDFDQTFLSKFFGGSILLDKNILNQTSLDPNTFLDPKLFRPKKLRPTKIGYKSLVKIRSVTAEILLIWTNVAWVNVTMTVGIC